jgi:aminopeptidase N
MGKSILKSSFFCIIMLMHYPTFAQLFSKNNEKFTHADSLRGMLTPQRTCYDVTYYDLNLDIDVENQSISGYNRIFFDAVSDFNVMQIDLSSQLNIAYIVDRENNSLRFKRDGNAVFITMNTQINNGERTFISVHYSGKPPVGKLLPWDGGFKWTKDDDDRPWAAVACQGTGASLWWPCKEHQSDEPDSMAINITVPAPLMDVSNGRLRAVNDVSNGKKQYCWFVSYPINNYNVTVNVGMFTHFSDVYVSGKDTLALDYYVKPYNLEKAKKQFEQVKPMLHCFENFFGRYPFWRDGYKLVETPYLGMEHQSCIAYGNKYKNGYLGMDFSGIGVEFDYIIIHETAHEWWGNSITTKDIADMWVHEGFGSYAEVLYVECLYGKQRGNDYVNAQKKKVSNDKPIIGHYNVNEEGSGDMYPKGSLMLHTIRNYMHNDSLWFSIIKGLQQKFAYKTVTTQQIENYISENSKIDLSPIFNQYLRQAAIPVLEYKITGTNPLTLKCRWKADEKNFNLPVWVGSGALMQQLKVTTGWTNFELKGINMENFSIRDDLGYFATEKED